MDKEDFLSNLKVGDKVARQLHLTLGGGYYGAKKRFYEFGTITKITPKRTKVYINGSDYNISEILEITEEMNIQNEIFEKYKIVYNIMHSMQHVVKKTCYNMESYNKLSAEYFPEDKLDESIELLEKLKALLGIEEGENK